MLLSSSFVRSRFSCVSVVRFQNGCVSNLFSSRFTRSFSSNPDMDALSQGSGPLSHHSDDEILTMLREGKIKAHMLEREVGSANRAVTLRRRFLEPQCESIHMIPHEKYTFDYDAVVGQCCENVVGFVTLPVGIAGPLVIDGVPYLIPLATTEGALVASTHRGCSALTKSGGVRTILTSNGMTRAPIVKMPTVQRAGELRDWVLDKKNFEYIQSELSATSRFARLQELRVNVAGRNVFLRFKCITGDAMGMNMITKGVTRALDVLSEKFPDMDLISISGNMCVDKKPSAMNWIDGRGKGIVAEAIIPRHIVENVLKTTVDDIIEVNNRKNLVGSAMAGSIGGFNAHAANIVSALYIACGQDPAQNIESSHCMTLMEHEGEDLHVSVTMPSIEVGTVGGGTNLASQSACLSMLGVKGAAKIPGENATMLARIVASTVMAGELSLISALAAGHLLRSHLALNRKSTSVHAHK